MEGDKAESIRYYMTQSSMTYAGYIILLSAKSWSLQWNGHLARAGETEVYRTFMQKSVLNPPL
jgi:hypothetical protein